MSRSDEDSATHAISDNSDLFAFVKWHGADVELDVVIGMLGAEASLRYFKQLPGRTFGYAEFDSEADVIACCNAINDIDFGGARFRACKMPAEPVHVAVSRNPEDTKFRADLNKAIKARAHDRLVYHQTLEKEERKMDKQKKLWKQEEPYVLQKEQEKFDALSMQEKLIQGATITPSFLKPPHSLDYTGATLTPSYLKSQLSHETTVSLPEASTHWNRNQEPIYGLSNSVSLWANDQRLLQNQNLYDPMSPPSPIQPGSPHPPHSLRRAPFPSSNLHSHIQPKPKRIEIVPPPKNALEQSPLSTSTMQLSSNSPSQRQQLDESSIEQHQEAHETDSSFRHAASAVSPHPDPSTPPTSLLHDAQRKSGKKFEIVNRDTLNSQIRCEMSKIFGSMSAVDLDALFKNITITPRTELKDGDDLLHPDGFFVSVQLHIRPK
jgi:hypothetical protein